MAANEKNYYTLNYHVYHDDWRTYLRLKAEIEDAIKSNRKTISVDVIKDFFDIQNKVTRNEIEYLASIKAALLKYSNAASFAFEIRQLRNISETDFRDKQDTEEVLSFSDFIDYFFSLFRWQENNGLGGSETIEPITKGSVVYWAYWLINEYLKETDPESESVTQYKRLSIVGLITAQFGFLLSESEHKTTPRGFGGYTEYLYSSVKYIKKKVSL